MLATHAVATRIARDVVEQHRGRPHGALVDVDDAADLLLAVGTVDGQQLARLVHLLEPGAQVLLRRIAQALVATRRDGVQHGRSWVSPVVSGSRAPAARKPNRFQK